MNNSIAYVKLLGWLRLHQAECRKNAGQAFEMLAQPQILAYQLYHWERWRALDLE